MNTITYISIILFGLILRVISMFSYLITFFFREQIVTFNNKRFYDTPDKVFKVNPDVKKFIKLGKVTIWWFNFHPYFWLFCLTCNGLDKTYSGSDNFMKEQKEKWFGRFGITQEQINNKKIKLSFMRFLKYFWICYRWNAIRNPHWAFNEWFFREGVYIEGTMKIVKEKAPTKLPELIMPQAKFKDLDGTYRENSGPYIRYPYEAAEQWQSTNEGKKLMIFKTHKGRERFYFGYCKIIPVRWLMKFLVIEILFGWNWWNGIPVLHNKYMFKVMDYHSVADYQKYQRTLSID